MNLMPCYVCGLLALVAAALQADAAPAGGKDLLGQVLAEAASAAAKAEVPVIERRGEPARAELAFTVAEPSGLDRRTWPVRGGIPFARGVLRDPRRVRLYDATGKAVPFQTKVLAYWPEGDVKWLLVEFLADISARQVQHYNLVYGSQVEPPAGPQAVGRREADSILLAGQRLTARLGPGRAIVSALEFDGKTVLRDLEPFLRLSSDPARPGWLAEWQVETARLVENGPVQATARLDGHFLDRKGAKWPFHCYIRIYRGSARLFLQFIWTFAGEPQRDFVTAYGLWTYKFEKRGAGFVGIDDEWLTGPQVTVRQVHSARVEPAGLGKRLTGCVGLTGRDVSVGIHLVRGWKNWPISFDAGNTTLRIYLYGTPEGTPLDLRYPDGKTPRSYLFWDVPPSDYYDGGGKPSARGLQKTHNLVLEVFRGAASPKQLSSLQAAEQPLLPYVSPEYYTQTQVFGHIASFKADAEFLAAELMSRGYCDFGQWLVGAADLTGFVDYGDLPDGGAKWAGRNPDAGFKALLSKRPETIHGQFALRGNWIFEWRGGVGWLEGERTCSSWVMLYLLAGRRKYFDFGYDYLLHCYDIDMKHLGRMKGAGCRHNQVHWRSPTEPRQHPYRAYYQMYWLTGDLRFYDAIMEAAAWLRKAYANDRFVDAALKKGAGHYPLLLTWQTTGHADWVKHVKPLAAYWSDRIDKGLGIVYAEDRRAWTDAGILRPAEGKGDQLPEVPGYFCGYGADDTIIEYAELTGDKDVAALALKLAYTVLLSRGGWHDYHAPERLLAFAYEMTGDERFVPLLRRCCYWFDPRRITKVVARDGYASDEDVVGCFGGDPPFGKNALLIRAAYGREAPYLLHAIRLAKQRGHWKLDKAAKAWLRDIEQGKLHRDQWPEYYPGR